MELAPEVSQQMRERTATKVWLATFTPDEAVSFDDLATRAGLEPLGRAWVEVDSTRARQILVRLLHKDLAYKSEVMPEHRAIWLADQFLGSFGASEVRFATNTADLPNGSPFAWQPATEFTFDSGVAALGEAGAGIYWVADED